MVPRMYTRVVERTRTYTFIWSLVLSLVHELERGLPVLMVLALCKPLPSTFLVVSSVRSYRVVLLFVHQLDIS